MTLNKMFLHCIYISVLIVVLRYANTVESFTIKSLRNRDFIGFPAETNFEYDLLNQTSRYKNDIFAVERNSDVLVKVAHRSFPRSIREFTIVTTVQLNDTNGGYLFSILNPLGTVIQLGLAIGSTNRYIFNITLIYTDARLHLDSQNVATFQVPAFKDEATIAVKMFLHKATLYINCHEVRSIVVNSDPVEIKTDSDSRLYVASAGPLNEKFDGRVSALKMYGDSDIINKICIGNLLSNKTMLYTMPPMFYTPPTIATPTIPSIPFFQEIDADNNSTLTENMDTISTTTPKNNFYLRLAALNEPYNGNLNGIRGADFSCYRQAVRAGIIGTFKAFLSTRIQSLQALISYSNWDVPVANIKGEMMFRSWKDLFDTNGGLSYKSPRLYSFNGKDILNDNTWPNKQIWHGSNINGEKSIESFCGTWELASGEKFGMAGNLLHHRLINNEKVWCKSDLIVLCIETIPKEGVPLT